MRLPKASAEAALEGEIAELEKWLAAQKLDLRSDEAHADERSRDSLYWHGVRGPRSDAPLRPGGHAAA